MLLIVDNTQGESTAQYYHFLLAFLERNRYHYIEVRSVADIQKVTQNIHGIILTGSPAMVTELSFKRNRALFATNIRALNEWPDVPVLGICFGCQFLNVLVGGTLSPLKQPFCREAPVYFNHQQFLRKRIPNRPQSFQFFCNYVIRTLGAGLTPLAYTHINGKRTICAFRHVSAPIFGILGHPEKLADTHWLLTAFVEAAYRNKKH